jgi:hypothetical protein
MTITIPRMLNVMIKPTKDPKLGGRKGMTFRSMENIPAVNATGREDYEIEKMVSKKWF